VELIHLESNETNHKKKLLVFQNSEVLFGIPLDSVLEIREDLELIDLPWKQNGIIGAIEYRGTLLPALDAPSLVGLETNSARVRKSYILIEQNSWKIAFRIDKFYRIIEDTTEEEKEIENKEPDESEFVSGITILDKKSLILLNIFEIVTFFKNKVKKQINSKLPEKLNQELEDSTTKESIKSICFHIDSVQFIVPIQDVLEVLENQSVTPLFKVTPCLRGLINLRGRVVPCMDISSYLGLPPRNLNEYTQFVLLGNDGFEIALCVDSVNKMKVFPNTDIQNNIDSLPASIRDYTTGILQVQKQTLLLLSARNLIHSKELQPYWNLESI
jgi:purine-binding chemotaxis protein CheW